MNLDQVALTGHPWWKHAKGKSHALLRTLNSAEAYFPRTLSQAGTQKDGVLREKMRFREQRKKAKLSKKIGGPKCFPLRQTQVSGTKSTSTARRGHLAGEREGCSLPFARTGFVPGETVSEHERRGPREPADERSRRATDRLPEPLVALVQIIDCASSADSSARSHLLITTAV